jgi:hypothetical protein
VREEAPSVDTVRVCEADFTFTADEEDVDAVTDAEAGGEC